MNFLGNNTSIANGKCSAGGLMGENGAYRREGDLCFGAIKAMLILCLIALTTRQAEAQKFIENFFGEEKINLGLSQHYNDYKETTTLLYKAKTKVLNEYIKEKIAKGELEDKKFIISLKSSLQMRGQVDMWRGENGFWVSHPDYPSLQELVANIDYFTKPDRKPFIDDKPIVYQPVTIWEKDGVSLQFFGDSLRYMINDTPLPFKANANLPVKIQDRYLFFEEDAIFVVQDMQTIKSLKLDWLEMFFKDVNVFAHPKWVNICWHNEKDWSFSYSYDNNKFYENPNRGIMTMTTASRSVDFDLSGLAAATIDWGDGSEIEKVILKREGIALSREYSNDATKKITITGKHVHELWLGQDNLIQLDVSRNTALRTLSCGGNQLTTLDVSRNTALNILLCESNQLTVLDVSKNTLLKDLRCSNNKLTALDLSQNTVLWLIQIQNNQFDADALNDLFKTLHDNVLYPSLPGHTHVTVGKRITIGNNPGSWLCDQSIAERKDWEVNR